MSRKTQTLWEEIEHLPEVREKILAASGMIMTLEQVELVLKSVPEAFPEGWKDCGEKENLTLEQQMVAIAVWELLPSIPINGLTIESVIREGVKIRDAKPSSAKKRTLH